MFQQSFILFLAHFLLNLFLPILSGIVFLWLFFGDKFKGILFYIFSWFVGIGVISFGLFNLQFIHFGISISEYIFLFLFFLVLFLIRFFILKEKTSTYLNTLKIEFNSKDYLLSFNKLSKVQKVFSIIFVLYIIYFIIVSSLSNFNLPTYSDDSFGNWHQPALHILEDGGFKIFGNESEILAKGRLGYPIFIPIFKGLISSIFGVWNEMYINIFQLLIFILLIKFLFIITYKETKNFFYSLLPIVLISGLPLVFFHITDGYLDFAIGTYSILAIYSFFKYLKNKDFAYINLGLIFLFILSYIKNDGFVVYFPSIIFAFILVLVLSKDFKNTIYNYFNKKYYLLGLFHFIYFLIPFYFIKSYYHLGWNQAAGEKTGLGLSSLHSEIFGVYPSLFFSEDNYNIILIIFAILIFSFYKDKLYKDSSKLFITMSFIIIFVVLNLVFLLTENYKFALDQTTVNRVFTVSFVIISAYSGLLLKNEK